MVSLRVIHQAVCLNQLESVFYDSESSFYDSLRVVVVIPTLNEEDGIGFVLDNLAKVLDSYNYAVLVVDGFSSDDTVQIAKCKGATVIFQNGKGYGNALKNGLAYACKHLNGDILVMMDADGTYDAQDVPALVHQLLKNDADMVVGNRLLKKDKEAMSLINEGGNRILSLVANILLQLNVSDTQCGLRVLRSSLVKKVRIKADGMPFAIEMLSKAKKAGAKIAEIPISYHERKGFSKLNRFKDGFNIIKKIMVEALS